MSSQSAQAAERQFDAESPVPDQINASPAWNGGLARPAATHNGHGAPEQVPHIGGTTMWDPAIPAAKPAYEHVSHPVDVHVGARVRLRRQLLGMSQKDLAAALGITFQQVQKFERGMNRISAGRLHDMSRALDVPVSFFFDTLPPDLDGRVKLPRGLPRAAPGDEMQDDTMRRCETLNLVRAYHTVSDAALRKRILDLVRSLAPTA